MTLKKNVMVVDDDIFVHTLSERIMTSLDCLKNMYSAFNGKEAIDLLQRYCINLANMPDIILLDLNMPVMNGIQFLKDVNTVECLDTHKLTMVMISSSIDPREIEEAKALGIKYFFSKPVSQSMIEDIFRQDY
ncbi:MAG: hypothetical protein DI539_21255 [Flavobacterium psychrophilum]|nr:MAG: hypothetical protein DI539_21255 [Flavobacterium psychrophilum]